MELKKLVGKIIFLHKRVLDIEIYWNIAKWKGLRFWYEYSKVRILLFQNDR